MSGSGAVEDTGLVDSTHDQRPIALTRDQIETVTTGLSASEERMRRFGYAFEDFSTTCERFMQEVPFP